MPKLNENYQALIEREVIKTVIPKSPIKDEMTSKVKEFMKEYFNLRKTSIDTRLLKILRHNQELIMSENNQTDSKSNTEQITEVKVDGQQNQEIQPKKKSVKFSLGID